MIIGLVGKAGSGKDLVASMIAPVHLVQWRGEWVDVNSLLSKSEDRPAAILTKAVQLALADPLKTYCKEVFDFSWDQLFGPSALRNASDARYARMHVIGPMPDDDPRCVRCGAPFVRGLCSTLTPREALQQLGTEWGRAMWDGTWISLGLRHAHELLNGHRTKRPGDGTHFMSSWIVDSTELVVFSDVRFQNEMHAVRAARGEVWRIVRPSAGLKGEHGAHSSETEQDDPATAKLVSRTILNSGTIAQLRSTVVDLLGAARSGAASDADDGDAP